MAAITLILSSLLVLNHTRLPSSETFLIIALAKHYSVKNMGRSVKQDEGLESPHFHHLSDTWDSRSAAACGAKHAKNIDNLIKYICTPIQCIEPAQYNRCVKQHLTVNKFILSRGWLRFMMKDLGSFYTTKISSWSGM